MYSRISSANVFSSSLSLSGGGRTVPDSSLMHGNDQAGRFILSLRKHFLKIRKSSSWVDTYKFPSDIIVQQYGKSVIPELMELDLLSFNDLMSFL